MQGVGPEDVGPQRKKPHVINDGALDPAVGRGVAGTSNHISRAVFSAQSVKQPRAPTIRLINEANLRMILLNRFILFEMPDSTAYRFDPHY
jgi:hypothetical protein